jgi:hypothetical protein
MSQPVKGYRHLVRAPHHHVANAATRKTVRKDMAEVHGFNPKAAVFVSGVLSSMAFFWFTIPLALASLPAITTAFDIEVLKGSLGLAHFFPPVILKASLIGLIAWIAQTAIQLWALPVLGYIGNATQEQNDASVKILLTDGEATREHTEAILDAMSLKSDGGLKQARDEIIAAIQDNKS